MKSHSDEKPHQCRYCEKAYKHFGAFQSHVLKKHQNTKMEMIQKLKNDFHILQIKQTRSDSQKSPTTVLVKMFFSYFQQKCVFHEIYVYQAYG